MAGHYVEGCKMGINQRVFSWLILSAAIGIFVSEHISAETMTAPEFGDVTVYVPLRAPTSLVLFASGDEGWTPMLEKVAHSLAEQNALVVGINTPVYFRSWPAKHRSAFNAAANFQDLGEFILSEKRITSYLPPILIGYGSGGSLVYLALAQSPPGEILGAISLGFCPELKMGRTPLQRGPQIWNDAPGGITLLPAPDLHSPWIVFLGFGNEKCDQAVNVDFVKKVPGGGLLRIDQIKKDHALDVALPRICETIKRISESHRLPSVPLTTQNVDDLPLVEVPANGQGDLLTIFISGDGGWASIDKDVAGYLAGKGLPTIGLNSLRYFWTAKSPDIAAKDVTRLINHYLSTWKKQKAVLMGYSMGADVIPFIANRLPRETAARLAGIVLISPGTNAQFEFKVTNWFGVNPPGDGPAIAPEIAKILSIPALVICGGDDHESLCPQLDSKKFDVRLLRGGHHFFGDYETIGKMIGDWLALSATAK